MEHGRSHIDLDGENMEINLACIRIKSHATDVILSLNTPMNIKNERLYNSEEVVSNLVESFTVEDYSLFGM